MKIMKTNLWHAPPQILEELKDHLIDCSDIGHEDSLWEKIQLKQPGFNSN